MKSKIQSVSEAKKYEGKNGTLYYRNYTLENGETINLGSKEENPSWGAVGKELEVQEDGEDSRGNKKYKRVTEQKPFGGGGKSYDNVGMMVGNAVSNAVALVCNGKVEIKDLEATADRICQISLKLKEKYTV
jgi:hypothetical protein